MQRPYTFRVVCYFVTKEKEKVTTLDWAVFCGTTWSALCESALSAVRVTIRRMSRRTAVNLSKQTIRRQREKRAQHLISRATAQAMPKLCAQVGQVCILSLAATRETARRTLCRGPRAPPRPAPRRHAAQPRVLTFFCVFVMCCNRKPQRARESALDCVTKFRHGASCRTRFLLCFGFATVLLTRITPRNAARKRAAHASISKSIEACE